VLSIPGVGNGSLYISKECLPLLSGDSWSFISLYKVKSWVRSCSAGTFLRNTSAVRHFLANTLNIV
uniref:Uncharacterized protein n=1 Tax=Junco hyemalis TaxID=40217 RepID=A0A8C5ICA7_JUNHY